MMGDFVGHFFLFYWIDLMELHVSLKNHLIGRHHWSSLLSPSTLWTVCVWLNSQSKLVVLSLLFSFKWITFFFFESCKSCGCFSFSWALPTRLSAVKWPPLKLSFSTIWKRESTLRWRLKTPETFISSRMLSTRLCLTRQKQVIIHIQP